MTLQETDHLWHPDPSRNQNVYVAFQAEFELIDRQQIICDAFACDQYRLYVDGEELGSGPARFVPSEPEFDRRITTLNAGSHMLTAVVHRYGVTTRILPADTPPGLRCQLTIGGTEQIPLDWKCCELTAYRHLGRRINQLLGWVEVCDQRDLPDLSVHQAGSDWVKPVAIDTELEPVQPKAIADCRTLQRDAVEVDRGEYTNRFGYVDDDPPVRFYLQNLDPSLPPEGQWYRFELPSIGLYRPEIELTAPAGTRVTAGYSDRLTEGRVAPFISLSESQSCHLDQWITDEGQQVLRTFSPRGFRFLELRVAASADDIEVHRVGARQRTYFDDGTVGAFECSDDRLNRIWQTSMTTLQSSTEDVITDPVRERGQWLADAVVAGRELIAVGQDDLRPVRRTLKQAAASRRNDGLIPALFPGQTEYLTSFSLLWIQSCYDYAMLTGDRQLLEALYPVAVDTISVFEDHWNGCSVDTRTMEIWDYLDWGYQPPEDQINVALNVLLRGVLETLQQWADRIGETPLDTPLETRLDELLDSDYRTDTGLLARFLPQPDSADRGQPDVGFHANVFGLLFDLFDDGTADQAAEWIIAYLEQCFPNNDDGPRLTDPTVAADPVFTPYFANYALAALWERGYAEVVLEQYRSCWGWMLEQANTWLEVFDPRWSHCHVWSGAPAWQLSRYMLGLVPAETVDPRHFLWHPQPGDVERASGRVPLFDADGTTANSDDDKSSATVQISWERQGDSLLYRLETPKMLTVSPQSPETIEEVQVDGSTVPSDSLDTDLQVTTQLEAILSLSQVNESDT